MDFFKKKTCCVLVPDGTFFQFGSGWIFSKEHFVERNIRKDFIGAVRCGQVSHGKIIEGGKVKVVCPTGSAGQGVYLSCEGANWRGMESSGMGIEKLNF